MRLVLIILKELMIGGQTVKVVTKLVIVMKIKLRIILCQTFCGLKNTDQEKYKIVFYQKI